MTPFLTLRDVAKVLRKSEGTWAREWKRWVEDKGFPPPVSDGAPWLWCEDHILAWADRALTGALREGVARQRGQEIVSIEATGTPLAALHRQALEEVLALDSEASSKEH